MSREKLKTQNLKLKATTQNSKLIFFVVLLFCFFVVLFFWSNAFAATKTAPKKKQPYVVKESRWIFGKSWQGRALWAYSFGKGKNITLYLGGVHSGIERGAVDLTNSWLSYLQKNLSTSLETGKNIVPKKHKVIIIPLVNPDGYVNYNRVNAHGVDLNRNFSVAWQMWGNFWSSKIYAGPAPFSEHESIALRDLMNKEFGSKKVKTTKLIDYHMGTNQVFAPNVDGILDADSLKFAKFYNNWAHYPAHYSFDYYRLTGDSPAWAVKTHKTRAITVEMGAFDEFEKNREAMERVITY